MGEGRRELKRREVKDEGTEEGTGVGKRQRWDDRLTIGVDWGT